MPLKSFRSCWTRPTGRFTFKALFAASGKPIRKTVPSTIRRTRRPLACQPLQVKSAQVPAGFEVLAVKRNENKKTWEDAEARNQLTESLLFTEIDENSSRKRNQEQIGSPSRSMPSVVERSAPGLAVPLLGWMKRAKKGSWKEIFADVKTSLAMDAIGGDKVEIVGL